MDPFLLEKEQRGRREGTEWALSSYVFRNGVEGPNMSGHLGLIFGSKRRELRPPSHLLDPPPYNESFFNLEARDYIHEAFCLDTPYCC